MAAAHDVATPQRCCAAVVNTTLPSADDETEELKHTLPADAVAIDVTRKRKKGAPAPPRQRAAVPPCAVPPADTVPEEGPRQSTLPFAPMTLAFHGVNYFVPKPGARGETPTRRRLVWSSIPSGPELNVLSCCHCRR